MKGIIALAAFASLGIAAPMAAQGRGNGGIPPGQRPPAGMCRVWINGVPPGRQPRPTSCSTAVRSVPSNGRVIWGDQTTSQRVYNPRVYDARVYDPRTTNRSVYDRGVYDPRSRTANGDVVYVDGRSCQREIVNGVVRTVCPQKHKDKAKFLKEERKHDKDHDDWKRRPGDRDDRDRFDRDRFGHR